MRIVDVGAIEVSIRDRLSATVAPILFFDRSISMSLIEYVVPMGYSPELRPYSASRANMYEIQFTEQALDLR